MLIVYQVGRIILEAWHLLLESSVYVLFGLVAAGLFRIWLRPETVTRHLGGGRFRSVFKAALLGLPMPLCSCGVLPAVVGLKKQGANNGAATAFMISTPETGVDSIAVTYALMDPVMTVARPVSALATAVAAGTAENAWFRPENQPTTPPDAACPVDGCCDGVDCPPDVHRRHHGFWEKTSAGLKYAATDVWADMAAWFFAGLVLAGLVTALIPDQVMSRALGGGLGSMLLMLVIGIPIYICATASTPLAAALILKGVSPGAALVFLLAGPATNLTSLTVLAGTLGRRAAAIYLGSLAVMSILCGLALNQVYAGLGVNPAAVAGQAGEIVPGWARWAGAMILIALSVGPVSRTLKRRLESIRNGRTAPNDTGSGPSCLEPG